ncbi:MAG: hypothetical protein ACI4T5_03275 [Prevotella sp.]
MTTSDFFPGESVQFQWYGQTVYGTVQQRQSDEPALFRPFVPVRMRLQGCSVLTCISPSRLHHAPSIPVLSATTSAPVPSATVPRSFAVGSSPSAPSIFSHPLLVAFKKAYWDESAGHIQTEYADEYYHLFRHLSARTNPSAPNNPSSPNNTSAPVLALSGASSPSSSPVPSVPIAPSGQSGLSGQSVSAAPPSPSFTPPPPLRNSAKAVQLSFDF